MASSFVSYAVRYKKKTKQLLTGMRLIESLLPKHQLFPEAKPRAIVGVDGNNKLAIVLVPV
jgi:hypothetical protein